MNNDEMYQYLECEECYGEGLREYEEPSCGMNHNGAWMEIIGYMDECDNCSGKGYLENPFWDMEIEGEMLAVFQAPSTG